MNFISTVFTLLNRSLNKTPVFSLLLGLVALSGGLHVPNALAASSVTVTPSTIAFTGTVGPGPLSLPVTFTNPTASSLSFTWSDAIPWLSAGHPGGTLLPGQSITYTMKANISGMAAGSYGGIATVTAGGVTNQVPITLTLSSGTATPIIGLNTTSLGFTGTAGGANPTAQSIGISNTGGGTLTWTASDNVSWLTLTPASGTNAGSISATVNLSGLAAGTYSSTITISAIGATTKTLPVTLTVAPAPAGITVTPSSIAFTGAVGSTPLALPVTFTNSGTASVTFTWSDSVSWLSAGAPGGTLSPGQSISYSMKANISGMAAGSYSGIATVTAGGVTKQVPITLTLSSGTATPIIGLNTTSLGFTGTAGGANPTAQSIGISNTGGGTLTWTASDNVSWLTLTPASGTNAGSISATVNLSGLAAGTYTSTITVAATGATAKTIPVTLTVAPAPAPAGITVTPSTIAFVGAVGPGPLSLAVTFTNPTASSLSFTWSDATPWLSAGHPGGTLLPGQSITYTMKANISGMAAGSYSGIATVTAGGVTKQVPITLTLSSGTATPIIGLNTTSLGFTGTAGGANPTAQSIGISNTGGGTLTWTASDNVSWLTLTPASGTNVGSVTASINLSGLTAGTYSSTITISAIGATTKTLPVTLTVAPAPAGITVTPSTIAFAGTVGPGPLSLAVTFTNPTASSLSFTWSDATPWLSAGHPGGTLLPGQSITYTMKANISGMAAGTYSGIATVSAGGITKQIPITLSLSASTSTSNSALLTWAANKDSDLAGYKVYQKTSLSAAYTAPIATIPKTATSYTVTGLTAPTTYFFVITAYDSAGNESPYSPEVSKSIF